MRPGLAEEAGCLVAVDWRDVIEQGGIPYYLPHDFMEDSFFVSYAPAAVTWKSSWARTTIGSPAAALYSREEFLSADGFDEDYFSYFEDVDLGFRIRLGGGKSLYVSEAVVSHVGSASASSH